MKSLDEIVLEAMDKCQIPVDDIEVCTKLNGNIATRYVFLNTILSETKNLTQDEIIFYLLTQGINSEFKKIQNAMQYVVEN